MYQMDCYTLVFCHPIRTLDKIGQDGMDHNNNNQFYSNKKIFFQTHTQSNVLIKPLL